MKCFEESLKLNPSNINSTLGKSKCLENLGRKEESLKSLENVSNADKIQLLIKEDKMDEAENEINSLLEKDENNLDAQLLKGYILCNKDDVDEAKKTFDKIIEKDKSNYLALYNCGLILLNNNRIEEAKEYLNKSLEIQPDFDKGLITMGNIYAKENQFDEAINNFDKILKNDPKNEMCLLNKAYTNYLKRLPRSS